MASISSERRRRPLVLDPSATAVVCVECQNGVLGPEAVLPGLAADLQDLVPSVARLLTAARVAGALVVHATFEGMLGGTEYGTAPLWRAIGPRSADWAAGHPAVQVVAELADPTDLIIARHHGLTPTWHTELLPVLRGRGVDTVILAGVSLNVAIPLTAGDATHEGFRVIVPSDAVAGTPVEYGRQVLRNTIAMLARVVTVDEITAAWTGQQR